MSNVKNYLSVLVTLTILSACKEKPPVIERCIIGNDDDVPNCICYNPDEDRDARTESIEYCTNFIATSPDNYRIMETWVTEKLKELEQCQSKARSSY